MIRTLSAILLLVGLNASSKTSATPLTAEPHSNHPLPQASHSTRDLLPLLFGHQTQEVLELGARSPTLGSIEGDIQDILTGAHPFRTMPEPSNSPPIEQIPTNPQLQVVQQVYELYKRQGLERGVDSHPVEAEIDSHPGGRGIGSHPDGEKVVSPPIDFVPQENVLGEAWTTAPSIPVLPNVYTLTFNETARVVTSGSTNGVIYMDAPNGKQRISRDNGYHDRYCGSVFKTASTPCNHFVSNGKPAHAGRRYLDFPEKRYCCYCCNSTHGCGLVAPDWMVTANASYEGMATLSDGAFLKWKIMGLQSNFYYHKDDAVRTPRRLEQGTDDYMDFKVFTPNTVDSKVFEVPSYCSETCGVTTICAALRGEAHLTSHGPPQSALF